MKDAVYLHIGNDYSVEVSDIVGIFDMDNTTIEKCTKTFLEKAEKDGICVYTTYELPKSFIITQKNGKNIVYISQLSAGTLRKRLLNGGGIQA